MTLPMQIYLDHNSTTPVDPRVVEAMVPFLGSAFGNPSSAHLFGSTASLAIEGARQQVAELVGAEPDDVTFCSSATESINTVISSVTEGRVITTMVEHAATLRAVERLERSGVTVIRLGVDRNGQLDLDTLAREIKEGAALVSVLWANNETGVLFPIREIAELCSLYETPLHVDAVQAGGKIRIDLRDTPITYLSINAHKCYGPKGIAALVSSNTGAFRPLLVGGEQEKGRRAGTENVPGIVGFGMAASLAQREMTSRGGAVRELRDFLEQEMLRRVADCRVNGSGAARMANTSNIMFSGVNGDEVAAMLSARGIAVSTGSACHASATEPSHVIRAMTGSYEAAESSVRFSLSHMHSGAEMQYVLESAVAVVAALR